MIEWKHLTFEEASKLDRTLPVIIPVGLIESHGPHLALSVDSDTADYFARRVTEESGAILAPIIHYGFADEMAEYPGTIGVRAETLAMVIHDISTHFCRHGFTRQIWLSGHGANKLPCEMAFYKIWESYPQLRTVYWNYWSEAGFNQIHHADKGETEIALAVGTKSHRDRTRDFTVSKPWYRLRSRHEIDPASGGINGAPSQADPDEGKRMREEIVRILAEKVKKIITAEQSEKKKLPDIDRKKS